MTKFFSTVFSIILISVLLINHYELCKISIPENPYSSVKLDDFYFINNNTGWVIRGIDSLKKVYKTTNAGMNWKVLYQNNKNVFRAIAFKDTLNGFIGTLDNDALLQTFDGGKNWSKNTNFLGIKPNGICSIFLLDSLNIFACGKYNEPAYFIKTTNGGVTWNSIKFSENVSLLVDCYFFDAFNGIIVGGISNGDYHYAYSVVLKTSDGGNSWNVRYKSISNKQICWKINFINTFTGFVTIQSFANTSDEIIYLKTVNSGLSWEVKHLVIEPGWYETLGIGFLNENVGIIGGLRILENGEVRGESYLTTDSGYGWQIADNYLNLNRIRIVEGNIYASGKYFYKINVP